MHIQNDDSKSKDETTSVAPLAELHDISKVFTLETGRTITVLEHINFQVEPREVLVLTGPSGSGKSTCLRILAGLLVPTQGHVLAKGNPFPGANPLISLVFQNFSLLPWLTVADNIALGLEATRLSPKAKEARIQRVIDLVGLEGFEEAYPKELSGGMKQRVGVARAIAMDRPILCLDEPFSALDVLTAETLRREIIHLWSTKQTSIESIVLITHNVEEAVSMGSRILIMGANPGQIRSMVPNKLPYPRDEKSPAFKALVHHVRDTLTQEIIPDSAPPTSLDVDETIIALPPVHVTEVIGLLERLAQEEGRIDAFVLAKRLKRESVHVLIMAYAAELLQLVETPQNTISLTEAGWNFVQADVNERKKTIHTRLKQLKIMQLILQKLDATQEGSLPKEQLLFLVHTWLPDEPPTEVLDTLILWGRYGELIGYNDDTKEVYADQE